MAFVQQIIDVGPTNRKEQRKREHTHKKGETHKEIVSDIQKEKTEGDTHKHEKRDRQIFRKREKRECNKWISVDTVVWHA